MGVRALSAETFWGEHPELRKQCLSALYVPGVSVPVITAIRLVKLELGPGMAAYDDAIRYVQYLLDKHGAVR